MVAATHILLAPPSLKACQVALPANVCAGQDGSLAVSMPSTVFNGRNASPPRPSTIRGPQIIVREHSDIAKIVSGWRDSVSLVAAGGGPSPFCYLSDLAATLFIQALLRLNSLTGLSEAAVSLSGPADPLNLDGRALMISGLCRPLRE